MSKGILSLVLHAHLPYVHHPEHAYFLEEDWFFEAITETYLPLLNIFEGLHHDGIKFRLTMSLTPPLINMMVNENLQDKYVGYIDKLIELSEKEIDRTKNEPHYLRNAKMYYDKFREDKDIFVNRYNKNLINGFKKFLDLGYLDIITCGATHGFFPLMSEYPQAINAQLRMAVECHKKHLGRAPTGIWLAECGFFAGLDNYLADNGIKYFFVDTHGILFADKRPKYGTYAPLFCSNETGVAAFGRDIESSRSVWSAETGYPGDFRYREFYRDIGYDLDFDYIKDYVQPNGVRKNTGIKYHKITGKGNYKEAYTRDDALEAAGSHAGDFLANRIKQIEGLDNVMDRPPIIISPYDAELFGHWWYEGPDFINYLVRKIHFDQDVVELATPADYLDRFQSNQVSMPSNSSWGHKGYSQVWLSDSNDWIYRHLHKASEKMTYLANKYYHNNKYTYPLIERALNQAARELLLAQSSDWAFIMSTGTMVEYAVKRTKLHINRFDDLFGSVEAGDVNEEWLEKIEERDDIFDNINFRIYSG